MIINPTKTDNGKDKYLKINIAGYSIIILAMLFVVLGMFIWLFFGSYNLTVTGYADVAENVPAYLYLSAGDIDKIEIGMPAVIGNSRGMVVNISDEYFSYDDLEAIYSRAIGYLHLSPDKSYYGVWVEHTGKEEGYLPFAIIYKTISPLEYFVSGIR